MRTAFIPSDGFIKEKFDELKEKIDEKLPIIGTITEAFSNINNQNENNESTPPNFTVELPSKWGGKKVNIINFDAVDPYIPYVKTLIRMFLWIPFLIKLYKKLPNIIY